MVKNQLADLTASSGTAQELLRHLELDLALTPHSTDPNPAFPYKAPWSFVSRMEPGNPLDPLLRQVLPIEDEQLAPSGYSDDPVGDHLALKSPGLLQKYAGRALLVVTGACAIHCRYCFRRSFPYSESQLNRSDEDAALSIIQDDSSIREVILSGGDPLSLSNRRLDQLIEKLERIPSLIRLRFHSRIPIVLPDRIDQELIDRLALSRFHIVFVIHANHPQELNHEVADAMQKLKSIGATLLNQSVLLKGVNDDAQVLSDLSERLLSIGVLPYYLHMLDRAKGTAHFEVEEDKALELHRVLMEQLPGYLVPKLVREIAGDPFKRPVGI